MQIGQGSILHLVSTQRAVPTELAIKTAEKLNRQGRAASWVPLGSDLKQVILVTDDIAKTVVDQVRQNAKDNNTNELLFNLSFKDPRKSIKTDDPNWLSRKSINHLVWENLLNHPKKETLIVENPLIDLKV